MTRRVLWSLAAGAAAVLGGCALAGEMAMSPHQSRVGPPPDGLGAEIVEVSVPVGRPLAAWYVPAPEGAPGVVLLHGITDSRLRLVERARLLRDAGYAVLLVDLPGHGESPGERIGYGWPERHAAAAAVLTLRQLRPRTRVGVVGISLGGAAAALAGRTLNADAVVLEMVYPTFQAAVSNRVRRYTGPLAPLLTPALVGQSRAKIGVPADSLRPVVSVAYLGAPVFVIGGAEDPFTPPAETRALYAAAPAPKALWIVEEGGHEDLLEVAPEAYRQRVVAFFDRHLRASPY